MRLRLLVSRLGPATFGLVTRQRAGVLRSGSGDVRSSGALGAASWFSAVAGPAGPKEDEAPLLPGLSPKQIAKIARSDVELRNQHLVIEGNLDDRERDLVRRKRMIYRSKQRGWLEADLLMGSWAVKNVPTLTAEELDQYELLLKEETIDIYNFISGKDVLPAHLKDLPVMKKLQGYALEQNMQGPAAYENVKKETNLT